MNAPLAVILPAAGASTRFGDNKLLVQLNGKSVIERSVSAFLVRPDVVLVLIASHDQATLKAAMNPATVADVRLRFVPGGASRALSVQSALAHVPASIEWVAIHDAARPLVSQGLIDRVFTAARQYGSAGPALPVNLTIKQAVGPLPAKVERTVPRVQLWAMQTPQIARRVDLQQAASAAQPPAEEITDDLLLLEMAGLSVWIVDGEESNLKLTTPTDLAIAQRRLDQTHAGD